MPPREVKTAFYEAIPEFPWASVSKKVKCSAFDMEMIFYSQHAKKVVSDSTGLVDFAIGLVNSVFNLPDGQVMFFENSINRRTVKSIMLVKKY